MTATRIYTSTATRTGRSTRTPTRVGTQGARSGSGCSTGSPAAPQFWSYSWQRRPLVPLSSRTSLRSRWHHDRYAAGLVLARRAGTARVGARGDVGDGPPLRLSGHQRGGWAAARGKDTAIETSLCQAAVEMLSPSCAATTAAPDRLPMTFVMVRNMSGMRP